MFCSLSLSLFFVVGVVRLFKCCIVPFPPISGWLHPSIIRVTNEAAPVAHLLSFEAGKLLPTSERMRQCV